MQSIRAWRLTATGPRPDNTGMTALRGLCALAVAITVPWLFAATAHGDAYGYLDPVPVVASPTCAGTVSAEAQVVPVQIDDRVDGGIRAVISYDAGVYDGSCSLTVTASWTNLDSGASGSGDITAVSTIDGHYGFIGYANTTLYTGRGVVVVSFSSHPDAELRITVT